MTTLEKLLRRLDALYQKAIDQNRLRLAYDIACQILTAEELAHEIMLAELGKENK